MKAEYTGASWSQVTSNKTPVLSLMHDDSAEMFSRSYSKFLCAVTDPKLKSTNF